MQTEDDLNASEDSAKAESLLMTEKTIPNIIQWCMIRDREYSCN